ncbi:MAG: hypothetical protein J6Z11_05475 [Candidatus Riflebacteria bacterium]|nr:hypothetical protein [Candidatus Riflebacteria bacterium]
MITKNDCLSILAKLDESGVSGVNPYVKKLLISRDIPLEVLKFISDNRGLEVSHFYEMLRRSHNQRKSPLYTNILKDLDDPQEVITTLSCLLTQILLYGKKLDNRDQFFREVRAEELTRVLNNYFKTGLYEDCLSLIKLLKSDLLVLEYIAGRRELIA